MLPQFSLKDVGGGPSGPGGRYEDVQEDVHLALSQLQGLGFDAGAARERAELLLELRTYVSMRGETMHTGQVWC